MTIVLPQLELAKAQELWELLVRWLLELQEQQLLEVRSWKLQEAEHRWHLLQQGQVQLGQRQVQLEQ
jgi:hypothetical protein